MLQMYKTTKKYY